MKSASMKSALLLAVVLLLAFSIAAGSFAGCKKSGKGEVVEEEGAELREAIVFVRGTDVWMTYLGDGSEVQLTSSSEPKAYPKLSPDGRYVAFTSFSGSQGDTAGASVKRVSLEGMAGPGNQLQTVTSGFAPAYLSDGSLVFARSNTDPSAAVATRWDDLYRLSAARGQETRIADFSQVIDMGAGLAILYVTCDPVSSKIAFVRGRRSDSRWPAFINADGSGKQFVETPPVTPTAEGKGLAEGSVAFADTNKLILSHGDLLHGNNQSNGKIYSHDYSTDQETRLTSGTDDLNPTISPDGSKLAFEREGDIYTATVDGESPASLTRGKMPCWGVALSTGREDEKDGDDDATGRAMIAYVKDFHKVCIANEDGSGERQIAGEEGNAFGGLAFSPDGKKLSAWMMRGDTMPTLVTIKVAGGAVTDLWEGDIRPSWTAQGVDPWFGNTSWGSDTVIYATGVKRPNDQLVPQVVKVDLSSRQVQVVESAAQNPAASPDGTRLVYVNMPADFEPYPGHETWDSSEYGDLVMRNLAGGSISTIKEQAFEAIFTPDGNRLVVLHMSDPDQEMFLTDLLGNNLQFLVMLGPTNSKMAHPAVSPTGDRVIYYRQSGVYSGTPSAPELYMLKTAGGPESVRQWGMGEDPAWSPR